MVIMIAGKYVRKWNELIHKILFRVKLVIMDDQWYYMGGNCFGLFPPSFYYTHTPEEIECITTEKMEKIQMAINELDDFCLQNRTNVL
jgi:hypothetical protein